MMQNQQIEKNITHDFVCICKYLNASSIILENLLTIIEVGVTT
jgi:hypothetical protein